MEAERWKQVDELLQSALQVPSEQRDEFLRQACAGDAGLEQEVRSLLASDQSAGGFLQGPAIKDAAQMIALNEVREIVDVVLGQTISHYRVLKKLGSGGMGVVYEAEDIRLGRHVALKLLLESEATNSKALQRFEQEARAISSLNHPNICTLYEVEEYDGKPVIVMELLDGQTLTERMKAGPVPLNQVLQWGIEIADALDTAHTTGLIHRDIKPANLFITSRGRIKVLDFGLAKLTAAAPGVSLDLQEDSLTSLGVIPGTTPYMSPEQVRGDELDVRTDLFSLGTVLYEVATGERAFAEKNIALTMDAVLNKRPTPVAQANPEIPAELGQIIEKALEKDLNLRYQSATELHADLSHLKRDTDSGHVTAGSSGNRALPEARKTGARILWKFVGPALLLAVLVAGGFYYRSHQTKPVMTDKDTVILADFTNSTGDAVFDGTLRQGLAAQLEQSPFLNLVSDERIGRTLSLMTQPKDARLRHELAREVCQRTAGTVTIEGSIATLGSQYVLGLKAVNCRNGDALAEEQVTANSKEQVLKALGEAATNLRERLGESLGSVQKYDTPPEDVTTSSLEALNAYSLGLKARHEKGDVASIPFFRRAVQLDPQFAMAYLKLGIEYWNIGETNQASQNCIAAFALRDRVSARERFQIEADYYDVTGNLQKAEENFQLWAQTYPQDPVPLDHLGNDYLFSGQYPQALEALLEEKKLAKDSYFNYTNLVYAYLGLNRLHDARLVIEQARARGLEPAPGYRALYTIDFLEGNLPGMQEDTSWAAGKEGWGAQSLDQQSDTEAYWGHRRRAWGLSQKAVAAARRENGNEIAARFMIYAAVREAEFGNSARAIEAAKSALTLVASWDVKTMAALVLARAGSTKRAHTLVDEVAKANPSDTLLNLYWSPTIRASTELHQNRPSQAIDTLQSAAPYELGQPAQMGQATLYPVYVRGEAYLRLGEAVSAATEFQKLLDHPGCVMNFLLGALAHLQLGRAYALAGDKAKSRIAYQDFFSLWKDADPDVPILKQAKAEYAKLQ